MTSEKPINGALRVPVDGSYCRMCLEQDRRTLGGYHPVLRREEPTGRLVCSVHDYVADADVARKGISR